MANYERLFQDQMQDPRFARAYFDARLERILQEMLDTLKEKILHDKPKEELVQMTDSIQQRIHLPVS